MANLKPLKVSTSTPGAFQEFATGDTVATSIGGTGADNTPADGHILIGSTAGVDYVDGQLTSTSSTLTITEGSGTLNAEINGGAASAHTVPIYKGSGVGFNTAVPGAVGQALMSNGASSDPSFQAVNAIVNGCRIYGATGLPYNNGGGALGTIRFGPCPDRSKYLTLDDGSGNLSNFAVSEISMSLASGFSSGVIYDIYVYNNSGILTFDTAAWSGNTPPTRGTDAAGRYTKSGATNELLVGAIYMNTATTTVDNGSARYVSNLYNTVPRGLSCTDYTASWSVSSATFVAANGNTTNGTGRVSFLQVASNSSFQAGYQAYYQNTAGTQTLAGFLINGSSGSASAFGINGAGESSTITSTGNIGQAGASLTGVTFIQRVEAVQGSSTSTGGPFNSLTVTVNN